MTVCTVYVIYDRERLRPNRAIIFSCRLAYVSSFKGCSYPSYIERSPVETGKLDGFRTIRQNRCRHAKACLSRRFRSCTIYARDFTGEGKICPVKHTFHDNKSTFTNLPQHRFMRRYVLISNTNAQMIMNIPSYNNVSIRSLMASPSVNYVKLETIINLGVITLFYGLY